MSGPSLRAQKLALATNYSDVQCERILDATLGFELDLGRLQRQMIAMSRIVDTETATRGLVATFTKERVERIAQRVERNRLQRLTQAANAGVAQLASRRGWR